MNKILPLNSDILNTNRFSVVGLGMALKAILGDGPNVDGLDCTPGAGLTVSVGPGAIYSIGPVDAAGYGNLPADTSDRIVNQGLAWGQTEIALSDASTTAGQSVVWLVEAQFQEIDGAPIYVPYYNQANTSPLLTAVNTVRQGVCVLKAKEGVPAITGTELPPVTDDGWTSLYTVTVAHGATSIVDGNIVVAAAAPFITTRLPQAAPIDSPVFTGKPTVPTPVAGENSTQVPNTAWIRDRLIELLNSPAFTGTPTAPTPAAGDSSTQLATTAWIRDRLAEILHSPAFTGIPTTPTPAAGDSSTQVANTAWVRNTLIGSGVPTYLNAAANLSAGIYWVDTSVGTFVLTLPASPAAGTVITLMDFSTTWGTVPFTLAGNGQSIMGQFSDCSINVGDQMFSIVYSDSNWRFK